MSPEQEQPGPVSRRILLALDWGRDPLALETAFRLADVLSASVQALFVEDADLLRLSRLPFAQEIGLGSAVLRRMGAARLERELRLRAAELEHLLARRAGRVHWSFETVQGALPAAALNTAADLYIFSRRASGWPAAPPPPHSAVVAVFDGSEAALRALATAMALADGGPLLVLSSAAADARAASLPLTSGRRVPVSYRMLPALTSEDIAEAVRQAHAGVLVLGESAAGTAADIARLLELSGVPLILVR